MTAATLSSASGMDFTNAIAFSNISGYKKPVAPHRAQGEKGRRALCVTFIAALTDADFQ
jgi:hypothetical protein